jgi:hypothetical protein
LPSLQQMPSSSSLDPGKRRLTVKAFQAFHTPDAFHFVLDERRQSSVTGNF